MLERYYVTDKELKFWSGDHFKAAAGMLLTTIPNFLFNIAHIIMIFVDLHTMKTLNDEVKIGGYGIGNHFFIVL